MTARRNQAANEPASPSLSLLRSPVSLLGGATLHARKSAVTMNPWVPAPLATAGAIEALTDWNRLHGSAHEHLCHRHVRLYGRPTGCAHFVFGSGVIQVEQVQGWQVEYGQALEVLAGARARARASMYAFAHAPTL